VQEDIAETEQRLKAIELSMRQPRGESDTSTPAN